MLIKGDDGKECEMQRMLTSNDVIGNNVEWGRGGGEEVGDNEDKREARRDFRNGRHGEGGERDDKKKIKII